MPDYPKAPDEWFNREIEKGKGMFDPASFKLMNQFLRNVPHRIALDIGAHVGTWSLGLSRTFERVIAFEPFPENYEFLKRNMNQHFKNRDSNVEIYNLAVGDEPKMKVYMAKGFENSGQAHITDSTDSVEMETFVATMIAIDKFTPLLDTDQIDLMKIDVEGQELNVLKGAEKTIMRCSPVICIELNGLGLRYGIPDAEVSRFLTLHGYTLGAKRNKDFIYVKANK